VHGKRSKIWRKTKQDTTIVARAEPDIGSQERENEAVMDAR
jgi:hypothetical protein